jgi:hypoxanthine phosphoribosyltransferase
LQRATKRRFVSWVEFGELCERLALKIREHAPPFDVVIGIARGGIPAAMVVADRLRTHIDFVNIKSYTGLAQRNHPQILSTLVEDVRGKHVLVVDDLVDEGDTMETVLGYVGTHAPAATKTAVLFTKPWSRFKPDYSLEVVDQWIVFPWELREFG